MGSTRPPILRTRGLLSYRSSTPQYPLSFIQTKEVQSPYVYFLLYSPHLKNGPFRHRQPVTHTYAHIYAPYAYTYSYLDGARVVDE